MAILLSLAAGVTIFLLLAPGPHPGRSTPLARYYARLGAVPADNRPVRSRTLWVRRLPLAPMVALLRRTMSPRYQAGVQRLLRISRLEVTHTYADFLGMKAFGALVCWLYAGLIMLKRPDPLFGGFLASLGLIGFMLPDGWLRKRARLRQEQVLRELPAFLSALAVALEAGLHLMAAIREAVKARTGTLAVELQEAADRYERGLGAAEALGEVSTRLEVPELTVVLTNLLQAFDKGAGQVVATVRNQAQEAWQKRRRRAEALAQTASIKLFLPLALLALPGFLIFLLGPAVLEVIDYVVR